MYLEDEIEKPALSAAVITYEDCDSRRVHLADTLTYTHTRTYQIRVQTPRRSRKKASGRQADKPVDGVSSQATHNEELKKPQPKKQN